MWEGIKKIGEITCMNTNAYHPNPNPPPSMGREIGTFYEAVNN
jgi:hypothetical protein